MNKNKIIWKQINIERKDDMSQDGSMRISVDGDGDMCVMIYDGERKSFAGIEFCTPGSGGGASRYTYEAVRNLFVAMVKDQSESLGGRSGRFDLEPGVKAELN